MAKRLMWIYLSLGALLRFGVGLHFATYVLFLRSRGLDLWEVNLVNAWFAGALILFEFPTGLIADIWGRKLSTAVACFISAAGFIVYGLSQSFWGFVGAEVILALGAACSTGATDAWIVDLLKYHDPQVDLRPLFTRSNYLDKFFGLAGAVIGGYLSEISLTIPWFGAGIMEIIVGILYLTVLPESYFVPSAAGFAARVSEGLCLAREALRKSHTRPILRVLLVVGLVNAFCFQPFNMYWQPFYESAFARGSVFGWFFAGISLFSMVGVWIAGKLISGNTSVTLARFYSTQIVIAVLLIAAAWAGPWPLISVAFFLLHEIGRGGYGVYTDTLLNRFADSKDRASQLSLNALMGDAGMVLGLVISGFLAERWSVGVTWVIFALLLASIYGVFWTAIRTKSADR